MGENIQLLIQEKAGTSSTYYIHRKWDVFPWKKTIYGLRSGQHSLKGTVQRPKFEKITRARNRKQEKELSRNLLRLLGCTDIKQDHQETPNKLYLKKKKFV